MRVLLFANTDWYLFNFRLSLAAALRDAGHEVIMTSPSGPYGERLATRGFTWVPAPMDRRSLNPLRELRLLFWLYRLMKRERIELVHGFTIKCAVYGSLAARLVGAPARINAVAGMGYVFTSSDLRALVLRPVVRTLLRLALGGHSARLILQNPDDVALFTSAGLVDAGMIRLIPGSGVDCERFRPPPPEAASEAPPTLRIVLPARLLWDKGLAEYVEAAKQLRSEGRRITFMLAGETDPGNPAAVPREMVQEWADQGLVQWLGHVDDMPALFRGVDVAVLPSYREGLPKGLIEAAACGLPLVTTDVPGCREVVRVDGVDGLLVPARDASSLARAIARLDDDPDLRARLGAASARHALERFDERLVIRRTLEVYEELAPSRRPMAAGGA